MSSGIELFAKRFPDLAKRVSASSKGATSGKPWQLETDDASALLDRWLEGFTFRPDTAVALSGIGDGMHLKTLLERLPQSSLVFCAEESVARFRQFLSSPLAVEILKDERVFFGVGELDDSFFKSLASYAVLDIQNAEPLIFAPLFCEAEAYYERFFLEFARHIDVYRKLYGTSLTKAGLWQRNSFANLPSLIAAPDITTLLESFKGVPLVMAGAGPSLDESLDFLRWAKDRAVIVAGNSSIRALVHAGIQPHFVLAADPNPTTDRGFDGVELGETVLVCPFLVYPSVVKRFGGRVAAWGRGNTLATYFRHISGVDKLAHVTEQGTVSACAFDLALILGSPAVFFVGQDFAARADGRMHASDSFYLDEGTDRVVTDDCRWCPGNTIETVPVEEKLFVYLKTFEQLARIYSKELKLYGDKGMGVFNLSRLGAKVQNMPYLDFEKAKPVLDSFRSGSIDKGWNRVQAMLSNYSIDQERTVEALRDLKKYTETICSFALKWALKLETSVSEVEFAEVESAKSELESLMASRPEYAEILRDGQLKMELYIYHKARKMRLARHTKPPREVQLEIWAGYFWAVAEGSYHVLASLDGSQLPVAVGE